MRYWCQWSLPPLIFAKALSNQSRIYEAIALPYFGNKKATRLGGL